MDRRGGEVMKYALIALIASVVGLIGGVILKHFEDSRLIHELMKEAESEYRSLEEKISAQQRTINQLEATINRRQVFSPTHCRAPEAEPIEWQELDFPNSAKGDIR